MCKLTVLASVLAFMCCGDEKDRTEDFTPCTCLLWEIEEVNGMATPRVMLYYAEYNEADCYNPEARFIEAPEGLGGQVCDGGCMTFAKFAVKDARLYAKKKIHHSPSNGTITHQESAGIIRFYIGDQIVYAKLFNIKGDPKAATGQAKKNPLRSFGVGYQLTEAADADADLLWDEGKPSSRVTKAKFGAGTLIDYQYNLRLGNIDYRIILHDIK